MRYSAVLSKQLIFVVAIEHISLLHAGSGFSKRTIDHTNPVRQSISPHIATSTAIQVAPDLVKFRSSPARAAYGGNTWLAARLRCIPANNAVSVSQTMFHGLSCGRITLTTDRYHDCTFASQVGHLSTLLGGGVNNKSSIAERVTVSETGRSSGDRGGDGATNAN